MEDDGTRSLATTWRASCRGVLESIAQGAGLIGATFRARERLRLTKQILAILRRGSWARGTRLSLGTLPNRLQRNRLAIRVRRGAVGGGAARNQAKRLVREVYRRHKDRFAIGNDFLVIVTSGRTTIGTQTKRLSFKDAEEELLRLCEKRPVLS